MKHLCVLLLVLTFGSVSVNAQQAQSFAQAIQYIKLANTLREVNKSQESINLLNRAFPVVHAKSLYWEAIANELLGFCYNDLNEQTKALQHLQLARAQYAQLKYVASAWAVNEVVRDISGKNLYAGIQIGTSDVKVAIFKTKYESDFYEKDVKSTFDIPSNSFVADASKSFGASPDILKTCLDSIRRYEIPNERIFIVLSSEVREGLLRSPENKRNLYNQLSRVLPNGGLRIDTTLTAAREAELFTVGAIPRKVWPTTSALEISGSRTMGGYFDPNKTFHPISLPIGVNTLVSQIESKGTLNNERFKREAQQVIKGMADTEVASRLAASGPGLQQRRTVGLGGSVALALVTYLHPEDATVAAVPITMEDMERFKKLVLNDYRTLIQPDLSAIGDPEVRNKAEKDLGMLQNQLNEKQLIAGTLWLESMMKAYSSASAPKRFVFIRDADIGWITGKFLETINYEYESTIAKGALYTR